MCSENKEVTTVEAMEVIETPMEKMELTVDELAQRQKTIKAVVKNVMVKDIHYGPAFPGSEKPTLLQPGADTLNQLFMFRPEFAIVARREEKDFIFYMVRCRLYHISSGVLVGEGLGSCSSMERKYRYRMENTGVKPTDEYWETRSHAALEDAVGQPGRYKAEKRGNRWTIIKIEDNPDIWDQHNTILKMAVKRAKSAATIQATASSDMFVPEGEEPEAGPQGAEERQEYRRPQEKEKSAPEGASESTGGSGKASKGMLRSMWAVCKRKGLSTEEVKAYYTESLGVEHAEELTTEQVNLVLDWADEHGQVEQVQE